MRIGVRLNYWSEFVGTFDPLKVVARIRRDFPEAIVDPTDYDAEKLKRDLKVMESIPFEVIPEERRAVMIRQVTHTAQQDGPTFRFEIPTAAGPVKGQARRYSVMLDLPDGLDNDVRGRFEAFLKGLRLGEPLWEAP